ncbi:hypothetical protein CW304_00840 [Bacillus sp. UFRGS-B20]|nr:hypothetical protein CW304_00840 [Bacillus sp. UFRGS-B20]
MYFGNHTTCFRLPSVKPNSQYLIAISSCETFKTIRFYDANLWFCIQNTLSEELNILCES